MAETKPTANTAVTTRPATSVKPKKSSNAISWIAPILCLLAGFLFWRYYLGNPDHFMKPDPNYSVFKLWPHNDAPKEAYPLSGMYLGGIVVPILIGTFLTAFTFVFERLFTIAKAKGKGNISEFVRKIQFHLANKDVDKAIVECDKQRGSVGNVMKAGLRKYKEMITNSELDTEQKILSIQKEVEEATALELPMLEKNLVFLSTIASVATLLGLFGTVLGMIRSFAALAAEGGGGSAAAELSKGISEALYNTALGIGTSAVAIIMYNIFTTSIDAITYGIDESGFTLTQSFATNYK